MPLPKMLVVEKTSDCMLYYQFSGLVSHYFPKCILLKTVQEMNLGITKSNNK